MNTLELLANIMSCLFTKEFSIYIVDLLLLARLGHSYGPSDPSLALLIYIPLLSKATDEVAVHTRSIQCKVTLNTYL